ncbi:hypothetical protein PsYK624_148430 [Phanerochaete sordida]|uniref:Uncharacterized protein n=1 Tax=Phanerochaete sordida TaxID=48140 RepID=A0A9P3GQQ6_9APHY|nr:hypothetical protein PsYK624_148430 [Phanerochaete sordida]
MAAASSPPPIQVDDNDPSIKYSGQWQIGGNATLEFDGTTHAATSNGSQLIFTFDGTSVALYGTVDAALSSTQSTSLYTFTVDDNTAAAANVTLSYLVGTKYQHMWWASGALSPATHTLSVTAADVGEILLWVDFVQYVPLAPASAVSENSTWSSSASSSTGPEQTSPPAIQKPLTSSSRTPAAPSASAAPAPSSARSGAPTPAGGAQHAPSLSATLPAVLVPVAVVLLLLGALLFRWRRRGTTRLGRGSHESTTSQATQTAVSDRGDTSVAATPTSASASPFRSRSPAAAGSRWFVANASRQTKGTIARMFAPHGVSPRRERCVAADCGGAPPAYGA